MVNFLSKNIFKIHYKFGFENLIWKIFPSFQNIILVETRDIKNKITKYHAVTLNSGKILWQNFSLDNNWWIGVEGIYGGIIIFHEYERPDFPIHKNIIAVDLSNHSIIWQLQDVRFVSATDKFVFTTSKYLDEKKFYKINLGSGQITETLSYDEIKSELVQYVDDYKNLCFPESITLEYIEIQSAKKYLTKFRNNIYKEVDTLQKEPYIILGYSLMQYCDTQILNDDYISIIDDKGKQLYTCKLIENAHQIVSPRFFIDNDYLIYIENKNILNVISLKSEI